MINYKIIYKHFNEYGQEYQFTRELMEALEYKKWNKLENVIQNAKNFCSKSNNLIVGYFI